MAYMQDFSFFISVATVFGIYDLLLQKSCHVLFALTQCYNLFWLFTWTYDSLFYSWRSCAVSVPCLNWVAVDLYLLLPLNMVVRRDTQVILWFQIYSSLLLWCSIPLFSQNKLDLSIQWVRPSLLSHWHKEPTLTWWLSPLPTHWKFTVYTIYIYMGVLWAVIYLSQQSHIFISIWGEIAKKKRHSCQPIASHTHGF